MRETPMRQRVVRILRSLHAVSIENGVGVGTPDVNCSWGWLELKQVEDWPARPETPVRIEHFTMQQKVFHRLRRRAGGNSCVLIHIKGEWFLFHKTSVIKNLGELTRAEMVAQCDALMTNKNVDELLPQCLNQI